MVIRKKCGKQITALSLHDILYYMLSGTLLVDYLNGLFLGAHIGEVFRILLFLVCIAILWEKNHVKVLYVGATFAFLFLNIATSTLLDGNGLKYDLSTGMKSCLFFIVALALLETNKNEIRVDANKVIQNNIIYGPALFYLSELLQMSKSSYLFDGENLGNKAMFLSLNSINIALMILYIYAISKFFVEKRNFKWGIACIYIGIPMLLLGTKTSMLMVIAVPAIFFLINIKRGRAWIYAGVVVALGVIAGIFFWEKIVAVFGGMFARQKFLFEQRDFLTYLFSTRNLRVMRTLEYYAETFSLIDIFPGRGYFGIHHVIAAYENVWIEPIEMDWVDILISYGPVGFLYTYFFAIKQIWKCRRSAFERDGQSYLFAAVIILIYGSMAGHLFLEAISSTFYAIVIAGCAAAEQKRMERYFAKKMDL